MIVCDTMEEAVEFADELAPEHLEACVKNPMEYIGKLDNVGLSVSGELRAGAFG